MSSQNPITTTKSPRYNFLSSLLFTILFLTAVTSAQYSFETYPEAAQSCTANIYPSGCANYQTEYDKNDCLCNNRGNSLSLFARCAAENDYEDLTNMYNILVRNCLVTNTPVDVSLGQWLEMAGVVPNTLTTMATPAATLALAGTVGTPSTEVVQQTTALPSSSSSSSSNGDGVGHLSGGTIALISCLVTIGCFVIALVTCLCIRR
jgi:hypothetical protein